METLLKILGILLLLPILITVVVLVTITLIGGYISVIVYYGWWVLLAVIGVIVLWRIINHFI